MLIITQWTKVYINSLYYTSQARPVVSYFTLAGVVFVGVEAESWVQLPALLILK